MGEETSKRNIYSIKFAIDPIDGTGGHWLRILQKFHMKAELCLGGSGGG